MQPIEGVDDNAFLADSFNCMLAWHKEYSVTIKEIAEFKIITIKKFHEYYIDNDKNIFNAIPVDFKLYSLLTKWATNWKSHDLDTSDDVKGFIYKILKNDDEQAIRTVKHLINSIPGYEGSSPSWRTV